MADQRMGQPEPEEPAELVDLRAENDHLRQLLDRAHDAMVVVLNDIVDTRRRISDGKRYRRLRAAGSCIVCGAEAQRKRTRCLDCGRKNSAVVKKRRAEKAA